MINVVFLIGVILFITGMGLSGNNTISMKLGWIISIGGCILILWNWFTMKEIERKKLTLIKKIGYIFILVIGIILIFNIIGSLIINNLIG